MTEARTEAPLTVSAVVPAHDADAFLADAIASIRAQDVAVAEIIVVDDGSTDGTAAIACAAGHLVRLVTHGANRGLSAARNTGIAHARGDVIGFLDADDVWMPDKTRRQLALLEREPELDIVLGHTQRARRVAAADGTASFEPWSEPELALSLGAALVRRRVFDRIGEFDEGLRFANDWDWFMRAREHGVAIWVHPEVVQSYRRHGGNMTEAVEDGNRDTLRMLRQSLGRRRASGGGAATSLPPLRSDG